MSKFESSAAYYYTLYTFKCLIGEIQIFLYYNILLSNIHPKNLCLMFKLVLQTVKKEEKCLTGGKV